MSNLQRPDEPGRPQKPPHLQPRRPATALGLAMRNMRRVSGWTGRQVAGGFGCSPSHISRIEHGSTPSRELVGFYERSFGADGLLLALFEAVEHADEQHRQRAGGHRPRIVAALPGDATAFVSQRIVHGTEMRPGEVFQETWTIRNVGTVPWRARRLERQGPIAGPGLIASERYLPVPDTLPGAETSITATLKAPGYDCTTIAYFKMVGPDGRLCFPDEHQIGLDVVVMVRRNTAGQQ